MLALPLLLTSCDDILGEWSKPAPAVVTPEPETPVKLTSITLNKPSTTLNVGTTETLKVDAFAPDDATDKSVTWSSDKDAVATVDENGLVTAVAVGTAVITATAKDGSGVTDKCTVTVSVPGLLTGEFSVADGKKVRFAQGNLQAKTEDLGVSWTWTLATNQWDYVGNVAANNKINGNGTVSANGSVDLFCWVGASNTTWSGALGSTLNAAMYGITEIGDGSSYYSTTTNDYGNVVSENLKSDWGNTIGTGWRTLTHNEWKWLVGPHTSPTPGTNCRTSSTIAGTPNARFAKAYLFGTTHGIIIFPDNYTHPDGVTAPTGINQADGTSWNENTYTAEQWAKMEAEGCVFLPAAGRRETPNLGVSKVNEQIRYWSTTASGNTHAYYLEITSGGMNSIDSQLTRAMGISVRLVYPAQ